MAMVAMLTGGVREKLSRGVCGLSKLDMAQYSPLHVDQYQLVWDITNDNALVGPRIFFGCTCIRDSFTF